MEHHGSIENFSGNVMTKKQLERIFYRSVPKARKINPFFRSQFELVYDASQAVNKEQNVLNIYSSEDLSSSREDCYRDAFFAGWKYYSVDFWKDQFIENGKEAVENPENRYCLNYPDNYFDAVLTTKVILEHVSEPQLVVDELYRVSKPGGKVFLIAPHIRRQHQAPHDYFRYTEYALNNILSKSGFTKVDIQNTGGFMAVVGYYAYFFQRGLGAPTVIEKVFDWLHYLVIEPICYGLDRLDNGYGRDMTLYFMIRATK